MERNASGKHNPHANHRERLRQSFLQNGLDSFHEHQALELLLFYGVPRRDMNQTAHDLILRFGSLRKVLEADSRELTEFPYIKDRAAALIKLVLPLSDRYMAGRMQRKPVIDSSRKALEHMEGYFTGSEDELVYGLFLDAAQRELNCLRLNGENESFTDLTARQLVSLAAAEGAASVILAYYRPRGACMLTGKEEAAAGEFSKALASIQAYLVDVLIYTDDCSVSLSEIGAFKALL